MPKSKIIKSDFIINDDNYNKNNSLNKKIIKIQQKKIELLTQQFINNNTFILND
jgi:hypothetical protein